MNKLPDNWKMEHLKSFGIFIRGVSYKKGQLLKEKTLNSVFLLRANNIQEKLDLSDLQIIPKKFAEEKIIQNNDILFAMSSGSKNIVGKNILLKDLKDYSFGAFCGLFRITTKKLNPTFLSYFLKSDFYKRYIIKYARGTNINNLRFSDLENLLIPIPPIAIQKQIAEKLDYLFDKIDKALTFLKENKEYIKKYRLSILKYAFEGKLTPSSKNLGMNKLPNDWRELPFSECVNKISIKYKIKQKYYLKNGKYPIIDQGQNFISGYSNDEITINIKKPVIVFGDHTRCFKYIDFDFIAGADGIQILEPKEFFNEKLFYYFCLILDFPNKGYSRHYQYLAKTIIKIPPLETQKEIVSILDKKFKAMDEIERLNNENIENLLLLKKSLLKEAFSGKLDTK